MMNYFFCFFINMFDTPEDILEYTWKVIREYARKDTRKRDLSECVKNTHSRIALRSIRATSLSVGVRYYGR
ncbi:hypothetical protein MNBD_GAMMA10-1471 [hydrothermal vent metagenome]|uniref:Uncharacterized protein n=1 Tax=hydrothermal vent metagenome TaxID=652676 RepID=A0A3B0XU61_9ZZZZ